MNEHPSNKSEKTEAGKLVGELMPVFSEKYVYILMSNLIMRGF